MKLAALLIGLVGLFGLALPGIAIANSAPVRVIPISYRAHDGLLRRAYVIVPADYGRPGDPPLPLVISPHGRGVSAQLNIRRWGRLPALGRFAVVNRRDRGAR